MSDGETLAKPVPPASRLGAILGWSLPALGVVCLIASRWIGVASDAAWSAAQAHLDSAAHAVEAHPANITTTYADYLVARAAYLAARAAYAEASLRAHLLAAAGWLSLLTVPGMLYARDPSLLGGPPRRLLRWLAPKVARRPQRRHPVTFYQGVGFVLLGIGFAASVFALDGYKLFINVPVTSAASAASERLETLAFLLSIAAIVVSMPLTLGVSFRWRRAESGHERPQA